MSATAIPAKPLLARLQPKLQRRLWQLGLAAAVLAIWQYVPQISSVQQRERLISPFFLSSPTKVVHEIIQLAQGANGVYIWPYLETTVLSALAGTAIAIVIGFVIGLICGSNEGTYAVVRPGIVALNAIPRVALIPLVVLLFGTTPSADAVSAVIVVVFIVFYNALEGARSVSPESLESVRLLGGSRFALMWRVRGPYAAAWVFASIPNAISFGLQGAVTVELFGGSRGVGLLLTTAVSTANATLTFAVVVILAIVGVILVQGVELLRSKFLGWWNVADFN